MQIQFLTNGLIYSSFCMGIEYGISNHCWPLFLNDVTDIVIVMCLFDSK